MITCRELVELLADYVANELPPERCRHIQQHLDTCPPCVNCCESYRLLIQLARRLPCSPLPAEVMQRLRTALNSHLPPQSPTV